ncbi:MAG: hypothetical protein CMC56_05590, partial [Flavobacteriaceae bacterium]|nr:hypothetical protein [Flavobacteriaceae bacterium]
MTILISGIEGQLGQALLESYSGDEKILGLNRNQFNLEDFNSCRDLILKKKPTWIINAAAFTDVNGAETEKEKTFKINTFGAANIIKAATTYGGKVIHFDLDTQMQHDYRQVYASIIGDFLGASSSTIIDTEFNAYDTNRL